MGLIRKSLMLTVTPVTGIPVRPNSKKQRVAKKQLKATQDMVELLKKQRD